MAERATTAPVLVTGANGHVGSHVVKELLKRGYEVRATVRNPEAKTNEFLTDGTLHEDAPTKVKLVKGDLNKEEGWAEAVKGVELIIHVASPVDFNVKLSEDEIVGTACSGNRVVLTAAIAEGCKRVVITSSLVAVMEGYEQERYDNGPVFTEQDYSVEEKTKNYSRSKTAAERVSREVGEGKIELSWICPGLVVGTCTNRSCSWVTHCRQHAAPAPGVNRVLKVAGTALSAAEQVSSFIFLVCI
eukprot:GHVU01027648.1.p1 GENE.GHVU01027648.1~~GHVU01027648.1.p1  ORF type:complete len:263 (+),score=47.28 GHVU01027648.1:57-791(+)